MSEGNDVHKEVELFTRHTRIKSDPIFDGLKPILFEPEYRVFIGANASNSFEIDIENRKQEILDLQKIINEFNITE